VVWVSVVSKVNAPAFGTHVVIGAEVVGVVNDWWDPNNVGLCVTAAYRAINTPGNPWPNDAPGVYLDTLVNNANPGVFDLVELNGGVPWVAATGWGFVAAFIQAFDTGVIPDQNYSILCQYANYVAIGTTLCGVNNIGGNNGVYLQGIDFLNRVRYHKGTGAPIAPGLATGNIGMASMAVAGYRDGIPEAGAHAWTGVQAFSVYIGARNNGPGIGQACTADIESVAIYNCILTNAQMLDVATAMSQL